MTPDDILRNGFQAMADASDRIVPGSGEPFRGIANREYAPEPAPHAHQWEQIPLDERTDICRYACAKYRCVECREERYA